MRISINPMALYKIIYHSSENLKKEVAGYLIGNIKKGIIRITDTATAQQKATSTHVKLNDLEMINVAESIEKRRTNEYIIGWYHSHPRMGAHFFSPTDINTQIKYQKFLSQAIGLVIDPHKLVLTSEFENIDCYIYHIRKDKVQKTKLPISLKLRRGLKRIYRHLKIINQNNRVFVVDFENFIRNELERKIIPNYYGTAYRINYQQTPKKIWAHIYTKSYSRFKKYDLIIKGYFRNYCKKIEKKFQKVGFEVNVTKDRYSNYYLVILNIEKAKFSQILSELLKELYNNWESRGK